MISLEERKLALLIQTEQLKKQLDSLRQQGPEALQLSTYTGRKAYAGLMDLVESFDSKGT